MQTLDSVSFFWHHGANVPAWFSKAEYRPICEEVNTFKIQPHIFGAGRVANVYSALRQDSGYIK